MTMVHNLISTSPALISAAASTTTTVLMRPPTTTFPILPVVGRRARCCLKSETAVARAHKYGHHRIAEPHVESNHFAKERTRIWSYYLKTFYSNDVGCLYSDAIYMSAQVCVAAMNAVMLACKVTDSASLTSCPPNGISADTIHATLRTYVKIFLRTAGLSHDKTLMKWDVMSFLYALRGLASISHILLDATLEALSHTHPRESLSEYAYNCDVKTMHREFNCLMSDLEASMRNASSGQAICKLVLPTIIRGADATESFVGLMVARRQRALGKASKVPV